MLYYISDYNSEKVSPVPNRSISICISLYVVLNQNSGLFSSVNINALLTAYIPKIWNRWRFTWRKPSQFWKERVRTHVLKKEVAFQKHVVWYQQVHQLCALESTGYYRPFFSFKSLEYLTPFLLRDDCGVLLSRTPVFSNQGKPLTGALHKLFFNQSRNSFPFQAEILGLEFFPFCSCVTVASSFSRYMRCSKTWSIAIVNSQLFPSTDLQKSVHSIFSSEESLGANWTDSSFKAQLKSCALWP